MPQGKRGKKPASLEMPEDLSPLEEDDIHVDHIEELEERTLDEIFRTVFGPNAVIDFSDTIGIDSELCIDRAEPASTWMQDISFPRFHDSFEIDDESEKELFDTAGLKTTGLGPEEASGVAIASAMHETESIGSYESLNDIDAKETTQTAGLKRTGLEPEHLAGSVNRAQGAVGGWQEANPSTKLQLGRQLSAPKQIPVHDVISLLRKQKEFDGQSDKQLAQLVYQGLSNKRPILPSTNSTLETRVQGNRKLPKQISSKGTGKKRGNYKKKMADKKLLIKPEAWTQTSIAGPNGGESISKLSEQEMPRFKEISRFASQPQAGGEDGKADSNTVKKSEGEKEVMSGLCVISDSSRPPRLTRFFNLISRISTPRRQSAGK
jgi:hypothetical protein